ncbi:hypothetical protein H0O02_03100 [Candidatus Micrarchaeota archaeon]|nr:hypothetical protein [Candidatus Micrarchaeota archaeon]
MQTLEALISFTVFMVFSSYLLLQLEDYGGVDDSLYRYQLANDAWRVLYLQGDFRDFSFSADSAQRDKAEGHLGEIYDKAGVCAYLGGIKATSCRSVSCGREISSISRVAIVDGNAEAITLSLCSPGK